LAYTGGSYSLVFGGIDDAMCNVMMTDDSKTDDDDILDDDIQYVTIAMFDDR
jgi:hypothetical protein